MGAIRLHILVAGRVQGVGYRYFARERALELGLSGWVRNREDGCVESEAQGDRQLLEEFLKDLRKGPPMGRVLRVQESEIPVVDGDHAFLIER